MKMRYEDTFNQPGLHSLELPISFGRPEKGAWFSLDTAKARYSKYRMRNIAGGLAKRSNETNENKKGI